ncbi:hypothetical protein [Serratia marcescens]|uniref:hypothetical protein n=1 Tax=Serratia marcescens TaxID=615 RepID=UPI00235E7BAD|nr:hypothetical protein [Serratia marcescens]
MKLTTERLREIALSPSFSANPLSHEVKYMARELLANREAQPVAWSYEWASCITCEGPQNFKPVIEREAPPQWAINEGQARNVTLLYAAPPAPAVPEEAKFGEMPFLGSYVRGWNDCRAAMLENSASVNQPVSSGYTFNSPVIPDGWKLVPVEPTEDMLRAAYRESGVYSAKAYRAMLAAAPEGGDGDGDGNGA